MNNDGEGFAVEGWGLGSMWGRFKAMFRGTEIQVSPEDYAWLLANPEKVGGYIRARIILGRARTQAVATCPGIERCPGLSFVQPLRATRI